MSQCNECEKTLFSSELDRCRDCIIEKYEERIEEMVTELDRDNLRHLNVIHTEIRNRVIKG